MKRIFILSIQIASKSELKEVAELLILNGAIVNDKDVYSWTALMHGNYLIKEIY